MIQKSTVVMAVSLLVSAAGWSLAAKPSGAAAANIHKVDGKVAAVDAKTSTVSVKVAGGQTLSVEVHPKHTKIIQGKDEGLELASLKEGTAVRVEYKDSGSKKVASWILLNPFVKAAKAKK
jgi:hypothetical protein